MVRAAIANRRIGLRMPHGRQFICCARTALCPHQPAPRLDSRSNTADPQRQVPIGDAFNIFERWGAIDGQLMIRLSRNVGNLDASDRWHTSRDLIPSRLTSIAQATRTVPSHTASHTPSVSTATLAGIQEL